MSQWDGELLFWTHAIWFVSAVIAAVASVTAAWSSFRNRKGIREIDTHLNGALSAAVKEAEQRGYEKGLKEGENQWRERK